MAEDARRPLLHVARVIGVLEPGGAQLSALRLSATLRRHGISTSFYAGNATAAGLKLAAAFGVEVEAFDRVDHLQWIASPRFARWLRPRLAGADVVHAHMFGAWWASANALEQDVPLVASEHNDMTWPHGDFQSAARAAADRVDLFFAHGPAAHDFASSLPIPADRLRTGRSIVDGLDHAEKAGLPTPRITFAGRLHPEKGPDVLLDALAMLAEPPMTLIIGDGPMRAQLIAQTARLGLNRRVRFPGWVHSPGGYIAGATAHIVPSREEAWSQSAVLGLGLGVPVIGTSVEGLPDTLGHGRRGILVPPRSPADLAAAIDAVRSGELIPNPAAGREYAEQFGADSIGTQYAASYRSLHLAARGRPVLRTDAARSAVPTQA